MKLFRNILTIACLFTLNSAMADNPYATIHQAVTSTTQLNGKIIRIIEANNNFMTMCMEPNSINVFLAVDDLGKTFVMGTNTNIYKQCADATCMNEKVIGTDQYVVSRDANNDLTSTPFSYQPIIDNNFGDNCEFQSSDEDCIGSAHCALFRYNNSNDSINNENSPTRNHDEPIKGKWIKLSNKYGSGIDCMSGQNIVDSEYMIDNDSVKEYHLQGDNIDSYSQCIDKNCSASKPLTDDKYFIGSDNDGGYLADPMITKVIIDPNYGQDCIVQPDDAKSL